jgi:hypothetical protein
MKGIEALLLFAVLSWKSRLKVLQNKLCDNEAVKGAGLYTRFSRKVRSYHTHYASFCDWWSVLVLDFTEHTKSKDGNVSGMHFIP